MTWANEEAVQPKGKAQEAAPNISNTLGVVWLD